MPEDIDQRSTPSKSGNLAMMLDSETMCFEGFYFLLAGVSIGLRT